jgi:DNA-binding protein HU-beta
LVRLIDGYEVGAFYKTVELRPGMNYMIVFTPGRSSASDPRLDLPILQAFAEHPDGLTVHELTEVLNPFHANIAVATQTNKKTAGVFLDTLCNLAYKEIKKNGEFVLPGFGKLVKQKRKARSGFNPKTQQKIKIPAKTVVKFRVAKAAKDAVLGVKK